MSLLLVFLIIVVIAGAVSYLIGQQRMRDIRAFAAARGLTVMANSWDLADCGFALFTSGNRRYWRNVLRGQWGGLPMTYCDYTYVVQAGRSSQTYAFSNAISPLGMQIPWVTVAPRSALGELAERSIGAPGIRFESLDFNDRFDVHSGDESFAVELIDARMIETLLGLEDGCHVVFGPDYLMVYARRLPVTEIGGLLDAIAAVSQRIPALVRVDSVLRSRRRSRRLPRPSDADRGGGVWSRLRSRYP
jgi:hypothetical protein